MLDKEVFFNQMENLLMAYPKWEIDSSDKKVMQFWYSRFEKMRTEAFEHMIEKYIDNETYNPTIAGLKKWDILPPPNETQKRLAREKAERERQNART